MKKRLANVRPQDFKHHILFYSALPLETPPGFEDVWGVMPQDTDAEMQFSVAEQRALVEAFAVVLFVDVLDDSQIQRAADMSQLIDVTFGDGAPILILAVHSVHPTLRKYEDEDAKFSALSKAIDRGCADDTIVEELAGMQFVWEVQNRLAVQMHVTRKFSKKLTLQKYLNDAMWTYLRIRLGTHIPKMDPHIAALPLEANGFQVGILLGQGTCGQVHQLVHRDGSPSGSVLKTMSKKKVRGIPGLLQIKHHIEVMKLLSKTCPHPNVAKLHEVFHSTTHILFQIEDAGPLDLHKFLLHREHRKLTLPMRKAQQVLSQLLSALRHLHTEANVVHLDLKPENIITAVSQDDMVIKISDFDTAIADPDVPMCGLLGTFPFCAPEIVRVGQYDPYAADIWSMGVVILELMCFPKILEKTLEIGKATRGRQPRSEVAKIWSYMSRPHAVDCLLAGSLRCELYQMQSGASRIIGGMLNVVAGERVKAQDMTTMFSQIQCT
jgi:hypothetical protein